MKVFHHPQSNDTGINFDTLRKADSIAASLRNDPINGVELVTATPVTMDELAHVHTEEYLEALVSGEPYDLAASNGLGWDEQLLGAVCASTGAVRDAALEALTTGRVAGALSSGLHHARADRGAGYCTVNGLVVAARAALAAGATRVLILDLDAHGGGGTASLIDGLEGVEQVDVTVVGFDTYASRPDATLILSDASDYVADVERALGAIDAPAAIDLVIYNAGMDPHGAAGGRAAIGDSEIEARERMVFDWAEHHGIPVAWTLAGGYTGTIDMDELVSLHRLTIQHGARTR